MNAICSMKGCSRKHYGLGFCHLHYKRIKYGKQKLDSPIKIKGVRYRRGYKLIRINGTFVLEHRVVMEKHLGRRLTPWEIVHHKDGNRTNNDISNLEVVTRKQHSHIHKNSQYICPLCPKPISRLCEKHSNRYD